MSHAESLLLLCVLICSLIQFSFSELSRKKLFPGLLKLQRRFNFSMGARKEKNDENLEKSATFLFNFWRAFLKKTLFCCFLMIKLNSESDFSGTLTLCIGFLGVPF